MRRTGTADPETYPMHKWAILNSLVLAFGLADWLKAASTPTPAPPQDQLVWHQASRTFDAQIQSWPVQEMLEKLSKATGWRVYVDTNAQHTVVTRFQGLRTPEALRRLVGELNFSLLPRTNGPTQLHVFRSSIKDATRLLEPGASTQHTDAKIPNELILRLKPGSTQDLESLVAQLGGRINGRIDELHAVRVAFDDPDAARRASETLAGNEDIASVESNYLMDPPTRVEPVPAAATLPPLNLRPKSGANADYTVVALLDSAVQSGNGPLKDFLLNPVNLAGQSGAAEAGLTHGTAMAETVLRAVAAQSANTPETSVRILPVDIYGGATTTSTFDIIRGLYAAVPYQPDIINLSLAGQSESALLHDAIRSLRDQGVLIYAASGNEPSVNPMYPAAYPEVTAVTAADRQGRLSTYANRGDFVDLIAPGTSLVQLEGQTFLVTGTSAATARISGTAAALLSRKGATPAEVQAALQHTFAFTTPEPSTTPKKP
jgi:hypothetical protein